MKIVDEIERLLAEQFLPKNAKIGTDYTTVLVDGKTFNNMRLKYINTNVSEMLFTSKDKTHTFNYIEQDIHLDDALSITV